MKHIPYGNIEVCPEQLKSPVVKAAVTRLQQLGVDVISPANGYDYALKLRIEENYLMPILVEIGYLMAQLTDHTFPEDFDGFSSCTCIVPTWKPPEYSEVEKGIRVDVDPMYLTFEFNLKNKSPNQSPDTTDVTAPQ